MTMAKVQTNEILEALNDVDILNDAVAESVTDFPNIPEVVAAMIIENYRTKVFEALGFEEE